MTPVDWWAYATKKLTRAGFGRHDARLILEDTIGFSFVQIISQDFDFLPETRARADERLARRLKGEPIAYILGWKEFYRRKFHVDRRVLIPRPETELLAEAVIKATKPGWQCADIGTGSGCLGITLALEAPQTNWTCTDVSGDALLVAQENAERLRANANFAQADMLDLFGKHTLDLIVSNPPYVSEGDEQLEKGVLEWEPHGALFAGETGLDYIECLVDGAEIALKPGGVLAFEFGKGQSGQVAERLETWSFKIQKDLAGIDRFFVATR